MVILCIKFNIKHLEYLRSKGHKLYYLADDWDKKNMSFIKEKSKVLEKIIYVNSLDSIEELSNVSVDILEKNQSVDMIITGAEYGVYAKGFLNTLFFNNTLHMDIALKSRNKKAMKNMFVRRNLKCAKVWGPYNSNQINDEIMGKLDYPVVVKPASGVGSFNAEIVTSNITMNNYLNNLVFHPAIESNLLVIEEYICGDEYHADIIWDSGRPVFISIGKYFVPKIKMNLDINKHLNGSFLLDPKQNKPLFNEIKSSHEKLNKELKLEKGVTHTEFFIRNDEIYFSEIATRYGGGGITEMIEEAYNFDIEKKWIDSELSNLDRKKLTHLNPKYLTATYNFRPKKKGIISKFPNKKVLENIEWVKRINIILNIGDKVTFSNPSEWCYVMIISGEDEKDFIDKIEYLNNNYEIEVIDYEQ